MPDKPIDDWGKEDVKEFLIKNKDKCHLDDDHIDVIIGEEFISISLENLQQCGLKLGPAFMILNLISDLKNTMGLSKPGK